ncbi:hypothetical protein GGI20_005290 [Coemansia sp. BCRC 34301]|nr:hypothetical protein GGI20_005290 [Coemansia sp. BCRC 34301]
MMKLATIFTFFASVVLGAQSSSSVEPNQACVKACQVAPEDQRETCMRVCSQFAEQGINFAPATASTHSSAPAAKQTAPAASSSAKSGSAMAKPTDSPAATSSGASAMDSKSKPQGEDNAEDHSSAAAQKSMSVASNGAHSSVACLGASALIIAAAAALF